MTENNEMRPNGFLSLILVIILGFLVLIIASSTIWAFSKGKVPFGSGKKTSTRSLFTSEQNRLAPADIIARDPDRKTAVFGDIGLLRAATADKKAVTVIISPFMPYKSADLAFQEELVQKTRSMRAFILDWFRARTIGEIGKLGESGVKAALLDGINKLLVLGKLETIYFSEYMVIE
jgi:flagellar basal body-associated protein FliL